jgi:hypothetical protein
MSQICGMSKNPITYHGSRSYRLNYRTFLARFRSSLTENSSVAWHRAPLGMTDETKWRRTKGLLAYKSRSTRGGSSIAAIPVYRSTSLPVYRSCSKNLRPFTPVLQMDHFIRFEGSRWCCKRSDLSLLELHAFGTGIGTVGFCGEGDNSDVRER